MIGPLRNALIWFGLVVTILTATWFGGRKAGKTVAKVDALKSTIKSHEVRNEVENRIATERDAKRRLHDEWSE